MNQLNVGVVGAGWMATDYHIPAYRDHDATRVVAVADTNAERRDAAAREVGAAGYPDVESMLDAEDLDVVSVCTPPSTHEPVFLAAVEAGCHVFCEKPLALDADSARRMADAAAEAGVVTQVGYLHRYYESSKRAMRVVREDLLGPLVEARTVHHSSPPPQDWYFDPAVSGGGVLRDLLPHTLDMYVDLFGDVAVERCETRNVRERPVEDVGSIALRVETEHGPVPVDVSTSWTQTEAFWRATVVGTEGWVAFDSDYVEGAIHGRPFEFKRGESPLFDVGLTKLYGATEEDASLERVRDFVDHVAAGDTETSAPVERGVAVAEAVDAGYELAGGEVGE